MWVFFSTSNIQNISLIKKSNYGKFRSGQDGVNRDKICPLT